MQGCIRRPRFLYAWRRPGARSPTGWADTQGAITQTQTQTREASTVGPGLTQARPKEECRQAQHWTRSRSEPGPQTAARRKGQTHPSQCALCVARPAVVTKVITAISLPSPPSDGLVVMTCTGKGQRDEEEAEFQQ